MKVLVTGSRDFTRLDLVMWRLMALRPSRVIHGAARGADALAEQACRMLGIPTDAKPADWERYGKRAGFLRNQEMLEQGPDYFVAFHVEPGLGKGTRDMVQRCKDAGVPGEIVLAVPGGAATLTPWRPSARPSSIPSGPAPR